MKITLAQFCADKQILVERQQIIDFFNSQYGPHWSEEAIAETKQVHVYGGGYWIEEFESGVFYWEGANGEGGHYNCLEDAEIALFNEYFPS